MKQLSQKRADQKLLKELKSERKKIRMQSQEKKPDPYWPFPQELIPYKPVVTKFNPDNHEDAPF